MNNIYRFRLEPSRKDKFNECLEIGQIVLGWAHLGNIAEKNKAELIDVLKKEYKSANYSKRLLGLYAGYFTRMLSLKEGDYVLISAPERKILIARVNEKYHYEPDYICQDMAHQVGITPIKYISIDSLSTNLKRTLDAANTVIWVKDSEQISEIADIIKIEDEDELEIVETITRSFSVTDLSKKISLQFSGDVKKTDLISLINQINFN